jgi:hypothetical protein
MSDPLDDLPRLPDGTPDLEWPREPEERPASPERTAAPTERRAIQQAIDHGNLAEFQRKCPHREITSAARFGYITQTAVCARCGMDVWDAWNQPAEF